MRPGEAERNLWWNLLDDCRRRGQGEYYDVVHLRRGRSMGRILLGMMLLAAALAGVGYFCLGGP